MLSVTGITLSRGRGPVVDSPDLVLDCTGMQCPMPVIKTAKAIKELQPGQTMELLATDPGVTPDMTAWTARTGNELVEIKQAGDVFHVLIRRGG